MKEVEVLECQVQQWYPRFKSVSIATEIHRLPEAFVSHLLDGDFFVPSSDLPSRLVPEIPELQADGYEKWDEEDEEDGGEQQQQPSFPELEAEVEASIRRLGGAVLPKLNWSAPKDATWISSSKNLKCQSFGDVSLLLKASDSIVHDLCHAFDNCDDKPASSTGRPEELVLALRKWYDLRPEMEFRAFVRRGALLGVCQREVTGFYSSLVSSKDSLRTAISGFFENSLLGKFELESYTFDVYVTKDLRVRLLDFNPWGGSTLPLLFSWEELEAMGDGLESKTLSSLGSLTIGSDELPAKSTPVEFRIIEREGLVQPNLTATSGVPLDYLDTGPGSAWDVFFRKTEDELKNQASEE
ncbi:cell division cycle protein 123 homolog [Selaginella moellendorffii]|uniref:cell division cycle protein 123 homolog n=1 Tax=Selaginella moellendorffii TaxID=88036 RepID=UPI000D1D0B5C|nr:cell division cycle protein 123 homolog [Selaginella moellendorffii]|eukprot:XP_024544364.1 cell division cycle protein 123 homolog [Selaginella moellendorffii]